MRVLITGACGFIGMHVAEHLRRKGHDILGIDSMVPYYSPVLKEERAQRLQAMGVELLFQDIVEKEVLLKAIDRYCPTHIIHLAAQAGVRHSLIEPNAYIHSNIQGFLALLEAARLFPSIPIIWASSSSVYGANTKIPFSVQDRTDCPVNLYGATKKSNEVMAYAYHHLFGLHLIGLRFFTVYGPWGRPDMAYFRFAEQIVDGEEIIFHGQGMKRDFTYIDDIVGGIEAALHLPKKWALFNLGNSHPEPVERLVQLLEEKLQKKARVRMVDHQMGDMVQTYADTTESETMLGFHPKISLDEGLGRFCRWFVEWRKQNS